MLEKGESPMKKHYLFDGIDWKNFLFLTIAGTINAIGVTMFISPVNLYDSGISGTSILLSQITPSQWTLSIFLLILNIPLFLFGLKKQGVVFTIYSIFTVAVYSTMSWLMRQLVSQSFQSMDTTLPPPDKPSL